MAEAEQVVTRLRDVRRRIAEAAARCGRDPGEVRLIAVSKYQALQKLRAAYAAGQRDFGENYVQELLAKRTALADLVDVRWHLVGHLQRNKVARVVEGVHAVHSVDSVRLVEELGRRCEQRPVANGSSSRLAVFVEVNLAREEQKAGCHPEAVAEVLAALRVQPALDLRGLMTLPLGGGEPRESRRAFEALNILRDQHGGRDVLPELSIGMSRDLEVAIECGSTWVRVGTDIFGARS